MNECVILIRYRNDAVGALMADDNGNLAVFSDMDAAVACADAHPLCQTLLYQIVELNEL
jgi:hypothetical protein